MNLRKAYKHQNIGSYKPNKWSKMITKKQLKIFEVFARNPFKKFAVNSIKRLSKERSNNAITIAMKQFLNEKIVSREEIGRNHLYHLNLNSEEVYGYISILSSNLPENIKKIISQLAKEIEKHLCFYSIVIFGSYALMKQTKDSDLDVAIFIADKNKMKQLQTVVNSIKLKSTLKVDAHIITSGEFREMLRADYENLGKEIARKNLPVSNPKIFYSIIREAIKNGSFI